MPRKPRPICRTEGCHNFTQVGFRYCPRCLEGLEEASQAGAVFEHDDDTEGRLPGWEIRQAARVRKAYRSARVEEFCEVGRLEFWRRKLNADWRKVA